MNKMYDFKPNIKDENKLIVSSEMSLKHDKLLLSNEKKEVEVQIGDINSEIKELKKQNLKPDQIDSKNQKLIERMMGLSNRIEEIKEEIKNINNELKSLKNKKVDVKNLETFSKKLTNLIILDYIDGNLNQADNNSVKKLAALNREMKEDLDSMMLANSFYGRVNNEVEELDPEILQRWKSHEKKTQKSNPVINVYEWISKLSPIKLISGSAIGGAALASITMVSFTSINTYSVLRSGSNNLNQITTQSANNIDLNRANIPSQWITQNGVLFSLKINNKNILEINNKIEVYDSDKWNFVLVASEDKVLNISYIDKTSKINLAKDLKLKKGQTYLSKTYKFSPPLIDGRLIISENTNKLLNVEFKIVEK